MLLNCGVEDSWESLELQVDPTSPSLRKSVLNIHWKDWCWSWDSSTLATWCEELTHWKRPWCWEDWRQEEKGTTEDEMVGWHHWLDGHAFEQVPGAGDGQGSLACCSPRGLQRVGHDWAIELNWSSGNSFYHMQIGLFGRKNGSCFCQLTVGWALEEQPQGVLVSLLRTISMFAKGWWHDRLDVHEFEQAPEVGKGQGSLACCSSWGCKESNTTERLNWESGGSHRHKPLCLLELGVWGASPSSESLKSWGATYWIQILCSSQSSGSYKFPTDCVLLSQGGVYGEALIHSLSKLRQSNYLLYKIDRLVPYLKSLLASIQQG